MPAISQWIRLGAASMAVAALSYAAPARAADVIAEWSSIQMPPTPYCTVFTCMSYQLSQKVERMPP